MSDGDDDDDGDDDGGGGGGLKILVGLIEEGDDGC